jgi:hypothetical protein
VTEGPVGAGIFFSPPPRPVQPPIQWIPRVLFQGVKRLGPEADHTRSSSAEVKNAWSCTPLPIRLHGMVHS